MNAPEMRGFPVFLVADNAVRNRSGQDPGQREAIPRIKAEPLEPILRRTCKGRECRQVSELRFALVRPPKSKPSKKIDRSGPTVLSLFAGAGGLDLGLAAAGFQTAAYVELESWACETLRLNDPDAIVIGPPGQTGDVREVDQSCLLSFDSGAARPDVVVGGPPCQPYSVAAAQRFLRGDKRFKRTGHADQHRGGLFREFSRLVRETEPKGFLLENVPGLLELDGGKAVEAMIGDLEGLGYLVSEPAILDAADFGVPQFRRRVFVMGARNVRPILPERNRGQSHLRPHLSVAHALAGMSQHLPNHAPRKHASSSIARYRKLAVGEREKLGRVDRLDPLKPSKTVIAGGSNGGGRSHLHPYIARTLTVRECARLQTFPDSFVFSGSSARQFTQVGNAIPPLLAEKLARSLAVAIGFEDPRRLRSAPYLRPNANAEELAAQLLLESEGQCPEWLYEDIELARRLAKVA
jgi:DNA (cytosine-5)-methyltransferase 1